MTLKIRKPQQYRTGPFVVSFCKEHFRVCSLRHKTAGLNWTELIWTELNWIELIWTELNWSELKWIVICESKSIVKSWTELNWTELNWTELNWIELKISWGEQTLIRVFFVKSLKGFFWKIFLLINLQL